MVNQFEGIYSGTDQAVNIEKQEWPGCRPSYKITVPDNENLWWGGFKSVIGAKMYAHYTLGVERENKYPCKRRLTVKFYCQIHGITEQVEPCCVEAVLEPIREVSDRVRHNIEIISMYGLNTLMTLRESFTEDEVRKLDEFVQWLLPLKFRN